MAQAQRKRPVAVLSELPEVPDFLGTAARVKSVADLLQSAQGQLQELQGIMVLNSHSEDDKVPTADRSGTATYKERFGSLRTGVAALMDANKDIREELTAEAVRRRKQIERKLESEGE